MSSKTPGATQSNSANPWKSKRTHRIIRRFKRGTDGKLYFDGQYPDEEIRRIVREHPIFYVQPALPFIGAVVISMLLIWGNFATSQLAVLWHALEILSVVAIILTGAYCAFQIFELWWVNVDVITSKRILRWRGLRQASRSETTLDKVTQVGVEQRTLRSLLLNYGDVKVYLAGGKDIDLLKVSKPKEVRDDIEGIQQSYKKAQPPKEPLPKVQDPQISGVLATLAQHEKPPTLEDADKKWEYRREPHKLRGPLRPFGGPLRITCEVHYDSEEYTVRYIQRSLIVLAYRLTIPFVILLVLLVGSLGLRTPLPFVIGFFIMVIVILLMILNYIDDVVILTNKRIIEIDRRYFFLFEEHTTTTYDKVTEILVRSPNLIELALDIGNIHIKTPGNNPDIHMNRIHDPFGLQDQIFAIKEFKEKVGKVKAKNDQKDMLNEWFSKVFAQLDTKIKNRGVPDLQTKDLWEAMEQAGEMGMRVIPIGESDRYPHIPAGKIVEQIPPPGTMVSLSETEPEKRPQIHVIVSKAAVP